MTIIYGIFFFIGLLAFPRTTLVTFLCIANSGFNFESVFGIIFVFIIDLYFLVSLDTDLGEK